MLFLMVEVSVGSWVTLSLHSGIRFQASVNLVEESINITNSLKPNEVAN